MSADLLPYIRHVNFSRSSKTLFSTSTDVPKAWNVRRNSGSFLRSFRDVTFPFRTNALVVSQPVNACRAVRARQQLRDLLQLHGYSRDVACHPSLVYFVAQKPLPVARHFGRRSITRCALAEPLQDRSTPLIEQG